MIVNCTSHTVRIRHNGKWFTIKPSGYYARVNYQQEKIAEVEGYPIYQNVGGKVKGLPLPHRNNGDTYIVSSMLATVLEHRNDVVVPNTAPNAVVKDEYGEILGVKGFISYASQSHRKEIVYV